MQQHNLRYIRKYYSNPDMRVHTSDIKKCGDSFYEERVRGMHSIWIITNGKMRIEYKEKEYILEKNDMFVFSSNEKYNASSLCKNTEFLFFNFENYAKETNGTRLLRLFRDGMGRYEDFKEEIDIAVKTIKNYYEKENQLFMRFFAHGIVIVLLSKFFEANFDKYDNEDILFFGSTTDDIIDYIHTHINERLTTDDLAKAANVSRRTLYNLFKKSKGKTPHEYIFNVKMNHAITLLNSGRYSIKEIANMVGYDDSKTFSIVFKRWKGVSPSKFNK